MDVYRDTSSTRAGQGLRAAEGAGGVGGGGTWARRGTRCGRLPVEAGIPRVLSSSAAVGGAARSRRLSLSGAFAR